MIEEIKNIGEQPENLDVQAVATGIEKGIETSDNGSPLGKFKDSETLLNAYNELQSEFTRKCQKLSETEKKLQEREEISNSGEEKSNQNEFAWNTNLAEFLQTHKNANSLVEEITNELLKNENLKNSPEGLEKAYAKVVEEKFVPHENLAKNQEFLDKYIYSNEEIKNKIINDYISSLQATQNPITVSKSGYNGGVAINPSFASIEDAGRYVEKMFKF